MTERRLGVGWGAVFCCCRFVLFFGCLFFSSQPKVSSLYPGYLRVSFSRTAGCFSVGRSSAEGRNYEQRSCGSLLRFDLNRKPRTDHFHRDHNWPWLSPQNFTYPFSSISLETIVIPRRNYKQCLCKILGGKQGTL